jgi:two-component system, sensor histidine kinase
LELRSWAGRGTCFTVDVPYALTAPQADLGATTSAAASPAGGSGLILVVADEGAIQVAMQSLLQSWGYSVIAAA